MVAASFASMHLARFDKLRASEDPVCAARPGLLFCEVGADLRAAGTDPESRDAFVFVLLGLHADEDSADRLLTERRAVVPWLDEAAEVWSAVLQPYRHKGKANYLTPAQPGKFFEPLGLPPPPEAPTVVITSAGWNEDGLDMARPTDFGQGVGAVRASMSGVPGLYSQQSFNFPPDVAHDGCTITFWRNAADIHAFAYQHGSHRRQMDRYHATNNADRTSFTRCTVLRSQGTWHGADPLAIPEPAASERATPP